MVFKYQHGSDTSSLPSGPVYQFYDVGYGKKPPGAINIPGTPKPNSYSFNQWYGTPAYVGKQSGMPAIEGWNYELPEGANVPITGSPEAQASNPNLTVSNGGVFTTSEMASMPSPDYYGIGSQGYDSYGIGGRGHFGQDEMYPLGDPRNPPRVNTTRDINGDGYLTREDIDYVYSGTPPSESTGSGSEETYDAFNDYGLGNPQGAAPPGYQYSEYAPPGYPTAPASQSYNNPYANFQASAPNYPQPTEAMASAARADLAGIPSGHESKDKWYRKYERQGEAYRQILANALGVLGKGTLDPVQSLGKNLQTQGTNQQTQDYGVNDFNQMINSRNQNLSQLLQAQEAARGAKGIYQGVESASQRARTSMVNQAMAAYQPMAYQQRKQQEDMIDQLLMNITQQQLAAEEAVATPGRRM